jgi:ABC-type multidrug transport system fused ATPase/permease subunit
MMWFGGPVYAVVALLSSIFLNVMLIGTTYWLSVWVKAYSTGEAVNIAFYLSIYAVVSIGSALANGLSLFIYCNGAWHAARRLHDKCLRAVMNVSLSWWKDVPQGRVVNRFSRDINSLDDMLSKMLQNFLSQLVRLFFSIGAISSILPIFVLPAFFICSIGALCGEMYTRFAVTAKRLVSSSQSPIFSQFSDSLSGLAVIRARHGMSQVFSDHLAEKIRLYTRAQEASFNANRWVSVRIDLVTALVTLSAGMIALSKAGVLGAGIVGFSLANATGLSETILGLVRAMNSLEVELQCFDRVKEYAAVEPEDAMDHVWKEGENDTPVRPQDRIIPEDWPRTGSVEFRNVTVRYEVDGPNILTDVNLKFDAGQRVAVVGRTGSGKSTVSTIIYLAKVFGHLTPVYTSVEENGTF